MSKSKNRLGKGLASVADNIGDKLDKFQNLKKQIPELLQLNLSEIMLNPQNRKIYNINDVKQLGKSMKKLGQLTPLRVTWNEEHEKYMLVSGEQRYLAAIEENIEPLLAVSAGTLSDTELTLQLIAANKQRSVTQMEKAREVGYLQEIYGMERVQDPNYRKGMTITEIIAAELDISKATVNRYIRALKLIPEFHRAIDNGEILFGVAQVFAELNDGQQQEIYQLVSDQEGITYDDAIRIKDNYLKPENKTKKPTKSVIERSLKETYVKKVDKYIKEIEKQIKLIAPSDKIEPSEQKNINDIANRLRILLNTVESYQSEEK